MRVYPLEYICQTVSARVHRLLLISNCRLIASSQYFSVLMPSIANNQQFGFQTKFSPLVRLGTSTADRGTIWDSSGPKSRAFRGSLHTKFTVYQFTGPSSWCFGLCESQTVIHWNFQFGKMCTNFIGLVCRFSESQILPPGWLLHNFRIGISKVRPNVVSANFWQLSTLQINRASNGRISHYELA